MGIVFAVSDVRGFKAERESAGLKFGVVHKADGFEFANAKDPAGNSISISSRGIARTNGLTAARPRQWQRQRRAGSAGDGR